MKKIVVTVLMGFLAPVLALACGTTHGDDFAGSRTVAQKAAAGQLNCVLNNTTLTAQLKLYPKFRCIGSPLYGVVTSQLGDSNLVSIKEVGTDVFEIVESNLNTPLTCVLAAPTLR